MREDLDSIVRAVGDWERLRGRNVFITGGTGFVGSWLLESFLHADTTLELGARATVLTRDPDRFRRKAPHLATHPSITLVEGDVVSFDVASDIPYELFIHGAAESSTSLNAERPLEMIATVVDGTRRALAFAAKHGTRRFLFLSSGAVYGKQPAEVQQLAESDRLGPDLTAPASAYAESKRLAELLCHCVARDSAMEIAIARCFAFVGPYLPLDSHFAAGNFIRDALAGGPIRITGDGTVRRTYLYASDLAAWLWTMLFRATGAYNVGSETEVSILDLAKAVQSQFDPPPRIDVAREPQPGAIAERYTPSTARARTELGLSETVSLDEALRRTIAWHRADLAAR